MADDPFTWARLSPYLDQVLDREPGDRAAWVDQLEKTQPEVAHALRQLLIEHEALNARRFLEDPLLSLTRLDEFLQSFPKQPAAEISAGAVLGPYRLLREIGHGGMSSVWLAERWDGQIKREVALKMPFAGPWRAQMFERFGRERDILATLTHPNIARLYDAGITASGQSYLAMEHVQGTMLTAHCDAARLPIRERLQIFLQVLAAVEFAHTHLVLHRDLKPSNILVTEHGRVVLLDFGIAKLLSRETVPGSPPTEMPGRVLTPDYASPEQLAGRELGTTSDVYSLGVVLCELLAGSRPYGMHHESRRALEEAIFTQDPTRPSQLVLTDEAAGARHTTPRELREVLKGDLDTILLKALKKAPEERYQSIDAFARDIGCYLGDLPVSARPDSAWYRSRRFLKRHSWQVSAATVALFAIVIGAATVAWQARVAAQQRDRAVTLASRNASINDFMSTLVAEAASSEKPVTVSEMIARSEKLALAGAGGNDEDRAAILETIARLYYYSTDDVSKSAQLLERALALVNQSGDGGLRARLTCFHAMMLADMGKIDAAVRAITRELEGLRSDPASASSCLSDRAWIAQRAGDAAGVLRYATLALDDFHQAEVPVPADEAALLGLVGYGHNMQGDNVQANRYYVLALEKAAAAGRERSPNTTIILNNWALMSSAAGVPKRALELYDQVMTILKERDPAVRPPAALIYNRGRALEAIGRYAQARDAYEVALELSARSKNVTFQINCLLGLASISEQAGDRPRAARYLREEMDLLGSSESAYSALLARRAVIQGKLALAEGRLEEARARFDSVLGKKRKNGVSINAALSKAATELVARDTGAAVANARTALDMATSLQGGVPYSNFTGLSWLMLGQALQARGETEPARKAFESAVTHLSNTVDANHPELVRAQELLSLRRRPRRTQRRD